MDIKVALIKVEELLSQYIPTTIDLSKCVGSRYAAYLDYQIHIESNPKLVQIICRDVVVASSTKSLIVRESFRVPVFYTPSEDTRMDLMKRSSHGIYCPFKGYASYWSLTIKGETIEKAALSYDDPFCRVSIIKDYITFNWRQFDCWYREDEALFWDTIKPTWDTGQLSRDT